MIALGGDNIQRIFIGNDEVWDAYLGDELVYSEGTTQLTLNDGSVIVDRRKTLTQNISDNYKDTLVDVSIGRRVTNIGDHAFCHCNHITGSLVIPDSVTSIGEGAFGSCRGFDGSLIIPNSVTSIGDGAFSWCDSLSSIWCYVEDPTTISLGTDSFYGTGSGPIYVPAASVSAYQSAWSAYASRIQAMPT